jgi:hypothetical protein
MSGAHITEAPLTYSEYLMPACKVDARIGTAFRPAA